MTDWGQAMFVTPGVVVDGELVTTDLVDINLGIRILLGSARTTRTGTIRRRSSPTTRSAIRSTSTTRGTKTTIPQAAEARLRRQLHLGDVVRAGSTSARTIICALDTGGGPFARLWSTALAGLVDIGYVKATGDSVEINAPEDGAQAGGGVRVEGPESGATRSSAIARAPTSRPMRPLRRSTSWSRRFRESTRAAPRRGRSSRCPTRPSAAASTRRCAACSRTTW